jgi:N-acetylneuraminate lyase
MQTFHGAWPALITPTAGDGGVDLRVLRELIEYLVGKGIGGLYLCGATGEGIFQSIDERKRVVKEAIDQIGGRVPTIVHVGCVATRDAVALAQHAQRAGAAGVSSILPPMGGGVQSIYLHYETIAASVPDLSFYPYLYGGQVDAPVLMQELLRRIPTISGSKYTGPNMFELRHLIELDKDAAKEWTIFSGMDEQCLFAAMFGAPANIGSTLNVMPGAYRELRASYERGDTARALDLQLRANRVTRVLISFGFPGALREAMRILGFDCGEPRLPQLPLSIEKREALRKALETVGFAELAGM